MIENLEWLDRNCLRAFPLQENAARVALNTGWVLPDNLLADACLVVQQADLGVYLSAVTITSRIVSVVFSSALTGESVGVASAVQGVDPPYTRKEISFLVPGVGGSVTFGTILLQESFDLLQPYRGLHEFGATTLLESRVCLDTGAFPVRSIASLRGDPIRGSVQLLNSDALTVAASQGQDNGDPMTLLTLGLANPTDFLSPCEQSLTPCECPAMPVHSINGVVGDGDGRITIEVVDSHGTVYLLAPDTLSFSILRDGTVLCQRAVMPDQYGRLPDPDGVFTNDAPPTTGYAAAGDTTFPTPVL